MYKVIIVFAAIGILAFSASQTYARPDQARTDRDQALESAAPYRHQIVAGGKFTGPVGVPEPTAEPEQRLLLSSGDSERDRPAAALLVYLACILVGSAVGVGLVRRNQREL
jgi:hypothetical protein